MASLCPVCVRDVCAWCVCVCACTAAGGSGHGPGTCLESWRVTPGWCFWGVVTSGRGSLELAGRAVDARVWHAKPALLSSARERGRPGATSARDGLWRLSPQLPHGSWKSENVERLK